MPSLRPARDHAVLLVLGILASPAAAQDAVPAPAAPKPPKPLFASDDPVSFRLATDFKQVFRDRDTTKQEWVPATFSFEENGKTVTVPIEVTTRGHWRLKFCSFAMLELKLPKEPLAGTLFESQGTLKLSTHCKTGNDRLEQVVVRDYLAHRAYNEITDMSFRVRLAKATYVDTVKTTEPPLEVWAYFREDVDDMAKRAGGTAYKLEDVKDQSKMVTFGAADAEQSALMGVYAYMVGMTDFSVPYQHNVRVIERAMNYYPVAYDFDWSGLVDAPYAKPDARLGVRSVRDRVWRGPECLEPELLNQVLGRFKERKAAIWALYDKTPALAPDRKKDSLEYLEKFYQMIDDPRQVRRELMGRCGR